MAGNKILCVAEKPSIAKAVAEILGGGRFTTVFMPFSPQRATVLDVCTDTALSTMFQAPHITRTMSLTSILAANGEDVMWL